MVAVLTFERHPPAGGITRLLALAAFLLVAAAARPDLSWALASNNVPLDSPVYSYLDKLAAFGLLTDDFRGIKPITRAEAARLLLEAEERSTAPAADRTAALPAGGPLIDEMIGELRRALSREIPLRAHPEGAPAFAATPFSSFRARYVYLDGVPRSYERTVRDPGGDGVFGIGGGLRPKTPFGTARQHGTEGTPLLENNEGVVYSRGSNLDLRFSAEAFAGSYASALLEPMFLYAEESSLTQGRINKGYLKLGGGSLELEVGRDANWLGLGERGNITLTNNAVNLDEMKLSSPEPVTSRYLWDLKYALIFSRLDRTVTDGQERHPWYLAGKLSFRPAAWVEWGINFGKEFGGPGVDNSARAYATGIFGGTSEDNTNNLGGIELRLRVPFLRNTEIYGEYSGEDSAKFWPIVESYLAGVYIPRLTADGSNDFRFEYFLGNRILYTNGTFPEGYLYRGMPLGHSQGGAVQDFLFRFRHWFSARHTVVLDYIHTDRGEQGRLPGQALEETNAGRAFWNFPLLGRLDGALMYGWERVHNFDLVPGVNRTNQLVTVDLSYRY